MPGQSGKRVSLPAKTSTTSTSYSLKVFSANNHDVDIMWTVKLFSYCIIEPRFSQNMAKLHSILCVRRYPQFYPHLLLFYLT